MYLRPEDVQDIVSLLDSLSQDEFELRTSELHLTVRRAGREGWTQESRVLSAPRRSTPRFRPHAGPSRMTPCGPD